MTSDENKINQIVKFVETIYHPYKTKVVPIKLGNRKVYTIGFYFEEIDDKYLTRSSTEDPKKLKEYELTCEIRTYIENYLGIKTTGAQPSKDFFPAPEDHGITIVTQTKK